MTKLGSRDQDTEEGRHCPKCGFDWRATEIPREYVEKGHYGHSAPCQKKREWDADWNPDEPCACPPRYYSHLVGIEYPYGHPKRYDGVSLWMCPSCETCWDRWTREETVYES